MKFYLAPMEGVTRYLYRKAYEEVFHNIDRYFTPFLSPNETRGFTWRELQEVLPEHNGDTPVIPQILTNKEMDFLGAVRELRKLGYQEVNLNLGCPSGTVVAKHRGSGFLAKPEELDRFLDEIYRESGVDISIKTRLGKEEPEEFYRLLEIYNQYPVKELIIHPRIQKDFYRNKPNLDVFSQALKICKCPVCYNGDIFTEKDYLEFTAGFPQVDRIMLGRGVIANPGLIGTIKGEGGLNKEDLGRFHHIICEGYQEILSGDKDVLFKMKELWSYMIQIFTDQEKYWKKIRKAQKLDDYMAIINRLFEEQELKEDGGYMPVHRR